MLFSCSHQSSKASPEGTDTSAAPVLQEPTSHSVYNVFQFTHTSLNLPSSPIPPDCPDPALPETLESQTLNVTAGCTHCARDGVGGCLAPRGRWLQCLHSTRRTSGYPGSQRLEKEAAPYPTLLMVSPHDMHPTHPSSPPSQVPRNHQHYSCSAS